MGDDQKALKKRLKVLMSFPENQICSDCPERQPRWASLIVPPPGAPAGSIPMGAFCCLECSGSHRRLGVHISFVRSINLDSWKEKEVLAMENGGNLKVNTIFESNLERSGVQKPSNHADGPTRERFIRDKYERRKFYDPVAFAHVPASQSRPTSTPAQQPEEVVGPPSDAARQRMEQRRLRKIQSAPQAADDRGRDISLETGVPRARTPPKGAIRSRSTDRNRPRSRTPPRLNGGTKLGQQQPRRGTRRQHSNDSLEKEMDLLDLNYTTPAAPTAEKKQDSQDLFNFLVVQDPAQSQGNPQQKQQPLKSSNLDIMSLYNSNNQSSMSSFGNMAVSHPFDDANSGGFASQQIPVMGMRPNVGQMNTPNSMQQQQMMIQQQQQMMMMKQQQQQRMMMSSGGINSTNNNMMMPNHAMHGNNNGFGAPMGSGPPVSTFQGQQASTIKKAPEKEDPFAQFGVNHFR